MIIDRAATDRLKVKRNYTGSGSSTIFLKKTKKKHTNAILRTVQSTYVPIVILQTCVTYK